ncbi:2'-5' RNA ligase family protein [Nocardia barduliensis]|uniref:2'-5' RNA ligase family protein n=1 Tax=Nocardia barduliensis TaxID=2736643 RepID=UPI00157305D0|nr:2'-5' RNA ligase family protein [Nocardia barduliensis]
MSDISSSDVQEHERRSGQLGYYWFLTFEQASELHSLIEDCQQAMDVHFFDPVQPNGLHVTLDRIAYDGDIALEHLESIAMAAGRACRDEAPFTLTIGRLTNLRGAIGFPVSPVERLRTLRGTLRTATQSVFPDAPVKEPRSEPHLTIAYPLFEGLSAEAAAIATKTEAKTDGVAVTVTEAAMVGLKRHAHSYSWNVMARIPLTGE